MKEQEKMRIDDYLAMRHQNDRVKVLNEIQQKVVTGEIKTEKQFEDALHQDTRCNEIPPEIGKTFPLLRVIEVESTMTYGDIKIPHHTVDVVWVMITE